MAITGVYCHIMTLMRGGKPYAATMYTTVERDGQEKEYFRYLDPTAANIAIYKLAHARGLQPKIKYNYFDPKLTTKEVLWYWEG